jgi:hypothetical protein
MAKTVKFYLKHKAVSELRNSSKMQEKLKAEASKIQATSGGAEFFDVIQLNSKDKYGTLNKNYMVTDYNKDISIRASNKKHNKLKK